MTQVTDASGGSWAVGAPAVHRVEPRVRGRGAGRAARAITGDSGDTGTTTAVNQIKAGTATYSNVTQGVSGGPFADTTVDGFNGTSSYRRRCRMS